MAERILSSGDIVELTDVPLATLHRWVVGGLLGMDKAGSTGRGVSRTYSQMDALAVAAGVRWAREGAEPERVAAVIRFMALQHLEHLEAEFAAGKTIPVPNVMLQGLELPGTGGNFIAPTREGPVARLMQELDLSRLWKEVKAKIAKLGAPRKRGRRPKTKAKQR